MTQRVVRGVTGDKTQNVELGLEEVRDRYRAALPEGELWSFAVTALDKTGLPSWSVTQMPGFPDGGHGYGESELQAEIGALGEQHEKLQSRLTFPTFPQEEASHHDLTASYGEAAVVDPVRLGLPAGSDYTPQRALRWVRMREWPSGAERFVPLAAAASSASELPKGYTPLFLPVSNGLGAGFSLERALSHAVLEIGQRDGNSVRYRAFDRGVAVDVDGLPDDLADLLSRVRAGGLEPTLKLAATDFGLTNVYVHGPARHDFAPAISEAANGEACHPDRDTAFRKALLEYTSSRTRLAFDQGPLGRVAEVATPGYLDAHRRHFPPGGEEPRALAAMLGWLELSHAELREKLGSVWRVSEHVSWEDLPQTRVSTPEETLALLTQRLEGFQILYLETQSEKARDQGVVTVKAVLPGLEVETASYGRIGIRNLRRLLEQESPLVGVGTPPPGAARVHLHEEDEEALGGPGWFDLLGLERLVSPFYSLYREPSSHAAQYHKQDQARA